MTNEQLKYGHFPITDEEVQQDLLLTQKILEERIKSGENIGVYFILDEKIERLEADLISLKKNESENRETILDVERSLELTKRTGVLYGKSIAPDLRKSVEATSDSTNAILSGKTDEERNAEYEDYHYDLNAEALIRTQESFFKK